MFYYCLLPSGSGSNPACWPICLVQVLPTVCYFFVVFLLVAAPCCISLVLIPAFLLYTLVYLIFALVVLVYDGRLGSCSQSGTGVTVESLYNMLAHSTGTNLKCFL